MEKAWVVGFIGLGWLKEHMPAGFRRCGELMVAHNPASQFLDVVTL